MDDTGDRGVELRRRLAEIADRVAALAPEDFASRHSFAVEADGIRAELQELAAEGLETTGREWAERAGRKGGHEQDVEAEAAKASIVSPNDAAG